MRCPASWQACGEARIVAPRERVHASFNAGPAPPPSDEHIPLISLRLAWVPLFLGVALIGASDSNPVTRLIIRDEVIWRVPVVPQRRVPSIRWDARRGPKCLAVNDLAGAAIADETSVDFLLRDRSRLRVTLDSDCPTLDFYGGFYLQSDDEKVCAGRDEIRSRMGGSCRIERIQTLVPTLVR
jgi:hypothetical protein